MRSKLVAKGLGLIFALGSCVGGCKQHGEPPAKARCSLSVFAASSLSDLVESVGRVFARRHPGCSVAFNFGSSNSLGMQLEAGARGDVFLSAARAPVDRLIASRKVTAAVPLTLFSNRLALITHASSPLVFRDICALSSHGFRLLAIGQPDAVPVGIYAREYLSKVNCPGAAPLWNVLQDRLLPMPTARAVLSVIEAQPDLIGIVYRTDALSSKLVKIELVVEGAGAPRIGYWGIRTGSGERAGHADSFLQLFGTPEVQAEIRQMGFTIDRS